MFGRLTRIVVWIAVVTHIWVGLIYAPWHQLDAHLLPGISGRCTERSMKFCRCSHHLHCRKSSAHPGRIVDSRASVPLAPDHDEHHCQVCHLLTQPVASAYESHAMSVCEHAEFMRFGYVSQSWSGFFIDPISRGPPSFSQPLLSRFRTFLKSANHA